MSRKSIGHHAHMNGAVFTTLFEVRTPNGNLSHYELANQDNDYIPLATQGIGYFLDTLIRWEELISKSQLFRSNRFHLGVKPFQKFQKKWTKRPYQIRVNGQIVYLTCDQSRNPCISFGGKIFRFGIDKGRNWARRARKHI